jgi:xylulose-5-phosphate/fructose-6-phosphate phosphoketolase
MEMLSEHTLLGWMEGYLLTGRHGFFHTYEAFAHVIDSMFNQHAKWLDISKNHVPWRAPVASENILLSSTVWRQDHNGFSHQDPGFIDLVTNKGSSVVRIYLPPDANTLLSVADHCLRSKDYINVIVADKQKHLQFLTIDEAVTHCAKGLGSGTRRARRRRGAGRRAGVLRRRRDDGGLGRGAILRERAPDLKLRFVNVVDLFKLQPASEHPHGSTEREFDGLFTTDKPSSSISTGIRGSFTGSPIASRGTRTCMCGIQGEGQHQHPARTRHPERHVPIPSGHRHHRARAEAAVKRRISKRR